MSSVVGKAIVRLPTGLNLVAGGAASMIATR
jgi:hypothetical protein